MKVLGAATLGVLLGMLIFIIGGQYFFRDFHMPGPYLAIMHFPLFEVPMTHLMNLGRNSQVFILSTILACSVILYERMKRKKEEEQIDIPPALHHKVNSILDPTATPVAGAAVQYAFEAPRSSKIRQLAILLPLAVVTFFLSATVSNKLLSQEILPTPQTVSSVLSVNTQTLSAPIPNKRVTINEVYYKTDSTHRINNSTNESEWIELFNPSHEEVSLFGWSLKDNVECDILPGNPIIAAQSFAIVSSATKQDFSAKWPLEPNVTFITLPGRLGDGLADEDEITLRSSSCTQTADIVDRVRWGQNVEFAIQQQNPATPGK